MSMKDNFLPVGQNPTIENELDPIAKGLVTLSLKKETVDFLGQKFALIFESNGSSRNGLSMINGALFALGSRGRDPEWREHCAGSLRELIHECRGTDRIHSWFNEAFKSKNENFPKLQESKTHFERINGFYDYFSEVHHHSSLYIIQKLQFLHGPQIKVGDDTPEMFIALAKEFIELLVLFFEQYAKNI